jgi:16S rRNA (cytosine967-C5)-methyltransferase
MDRIEMVNVRCNAREAAFLAALSSLREESFAKEYLEKWFREEKPSYSDFRLAQEIAYGTIRMALALDYLAIQLSAKNKLSLKLKEKVLLRSAFYQYYYMTQIPLYAIADETAKIAKKHCHSIFGKFLNATLRKVSSTPFSLPQGDSFDQMAIRYSYPPSFVQSVLREYGLERAKQIMEAGNEAASLMYRIRDSSELGIAVLTDPSKLAELIQSPLYYIQNITPAYLIKNLCEKRMIPKPQRILDLCSSPGGKLLAVHDYIQSGQLFANDVSEHKISRLRENCEKYALKAILTCSKGENYESTEKFDIIIVDTPCSNTGVLNKRPEARWRLSIDQEKQLEDIQKNLLKRASELISNQGEIWYMTCSILKAENEGMSAWACDQLGLRTNYQETILSNRQGWDGGFTCQMTRR